MIDHLMQRIKLIFSWGKITRVEQDKLQVEFPTGDINDNIKYLHHYGFISRANPNATAYCIFIGGDRSQGYALLAEDKTTHIDLQAGEVAIVDDKNNLIHLTSNGIEVRSNKNITVKARNQGEINISDNNDNLIQLSAAGIKLQSAAKVTIDASNTEITGNLSVDGNIESAGDVSDSTSSMADMRTSYNSHNHIYNNNKITNPPLPTMP